MGDDEKTIEENVDLILKQNKDILLRLSTLEISNHRGAVGGSAAQGPRDSHDDGEDQRGSKVKYQFNPYSLPFQAANISSTPIQAGSVPNQALLGDSVPRLYGQLRTLDIQGNYLEIKKQLASERLPPELSLHESRQGINRDQQPLFNVIVQNARYVETALKKLSKITDSTTCESDLEDLFGILLAQIRYLQDEYAVLIVNSTSDKETAKLFRQFRKILQVYQRKLSRIFEEQQVLLNIVIKYHIITTHEAVVGGSVVLVPDFQEVVIASLLTDPLDIRLIVIPLMIIITLAGPVLVVVLVKRNINCFKCVCLVAGH